ADFWAGSELWREPLLAGVLAAALLSYLGVFVVLRRMVFVSAALSEISGVGVATAFYVGAVAGIDPHSHGALPILLEPVWFSLLFVSYGAGTATVQGVGVLRYEVLLNFIIAVVISVATRAVGALPVFVFTVVPAAAALMVTENIRATMPLSIAFGIISAAVGYYISWIEQLPTGATMVVVASIFLLPGLVRLAKRSTV